VAVLFAAAAPAAAADLYWSGIGTWNTTTANWGASTGGPYTGSIWSNATPDAAFFEGTAGTVSLGEAITAAGLTFTTTGYTVTGNTLTLSGTPTIATGTGVTASVNSSLSGPVTKSGAGILQLGRGGGNGGGSTGVSVTAGTMILAGASAAFDAGYFTGATPITASGGSTLQIDQAWNIGSVNAVTINASTLAFNIAGGDGAASTNYVNNLTLLGGATVTGPWRAGNAAAPSLVSGGNGTNTISGNLYLVNSGSTTWTVNVADGSAANDLVFSGSIFDLGQNGTSPSLGGTVVVKSGAGTFAMAGANQYVGATTISAGELLLDYATQNNSKLSNTASLSIATGTLTLSGGSHTEVVASTTLSGAATVARSSGASVLQMGTISRSATSTIDFSADGVATIDNLNTATGILGGWATVGGAAWATNASNAAGGAVGSYTAYTDVPFAGAIADDATANIRLTGGSSGDITLAAATTTINTLQQGQASATVIDTAGQTLRLGSGGLLVPAGTGSLTIGATAASGTLTAGSADNTAGTLALLVNDPATPLAINSVVANNGSGALTLAKSGVGVAVLNAAPTYTGTTAINAGTLRLQSANDSTFSSAVSGAGILAKAGTGVLTLPNANTHTGGTRLEAGILAVGNNAALGTGPLTLAGGTIRPTTNRVIGNAISAATGTTSGLIDGGAGDLMYTGAATGNGNLAANSTASRSMWLQGDWSGFTGQLTFTVNGGGTNYRLGGTPGATSSNTGTNGSDFGQAAVVLAGTGTDRGLSWNGAQGATVRVGTLSGTGGRIISGADGRDANWQVGGLNQTSSAAVVITGNATSLTKVGTGTLTLTGSSTYAGGTTVSAGTLNLDAAAAIGAGSLTIAAGASVNALRAFAISTDGAAAGRVVNVAGSLSMADSEYVQTYNLTAGSIAAPATGGGYLRAATSGLFINSLAATTSSQITGRIDLTFNSATLNVADGAAADDLVIPAAILQNTGAGSGAKSITKTGAGTLLLSGTNSYSGGTFINAGLVKAGSSRAFGLENAAASTITIASGATLDINRVTGNTGDFFYGLTIAGSGTAGQGALINTGANGGSFLRQTPNITLSANATIGGSGNILMIDGGYGANSLNLAGNTLTKTGTNTLFLANTTVSAGTIDIQQGTLSHFQTAANASAAAITLADAAGATLALNNFGLQVGSLAGGGATGGNVTLGSATMTLGGRNENTSFGGAISGTGAVVKTGTGTQTFAAASTYSGGTTINGGTLVAGSANAFGTTGAISVGATGALGVGDGVSFTRPFSLTAGGRVRTGNNSTVSLPSVTALAAWESQSGTGDQTLAEILDASGSTTPTALFSAWTANPGDYLSDILTLEGTGAGNTYVLSMGYTGSSGNLNIWYRANVSDSFVPLGTSFAGNVPWTSSFTTPGQYGVDTSAGTVWAVTDHNSQFVVVPEPGTLGLAAVWLAGGFWYLRGRWVARRP
jgi:autotransporter-associated beta strand protein